MDHKARLKEQQCGLQARRIDALLVTHPANVRYLCGFTGSAGALAITEKAAVLFTDRRYTAQAREEVAGAKILIVRQGLLRAAAQWLAERGKGRGQGVRRVGIEADHVTVAGRAQLAAALPSGFRIQGIPAAVERARMVKDAEEIALLRAAAKLGTSLFDTALENIQAGVSEIEVAAQMEFCARQRGAEAMSFETIIASGPRSALPHGRATAGAIPAGGFVVCDFGVILAGYCSDMTRTVCVGHPSVQMRRGYEAVREAQQAALEAARPGAALATVDGAARKVLRRNGLGRYFTHSTGHGVGLEIHEAPRVAAGQTDALRPGMVITIEPGVYLPGKWGVRIEDTVAITDRGCEILTPTTKELISI